MRPNFADIMVDDAVFFHDTLTAGKPYISALPRNHDSFAFVTSGTLKYQKNGNSVTVAKGQIAYIAKGSTDKSSAYDCNAVSYIAVNFNFKKNTSLLPFETVCSNRNSFQYERLFQKAILEYNMALPGSQMICNGILHQIIGMLYNDFAFTGMKDKMANKLEYALDFLNQNYYRQDLRISELADKINISEKHFRRLFEKVYGQKPHEFIIDFRLNKAELLLLNTSKSISDIAIQCGFADVYSFSHCFKKKYFISPKMYRTANPADLSKDEKIHKSQYST